MNIDPEIAKAVQNFTVMAIPVLVAITTHEAAHGFAASRLGDDTAQRLGRVTFNPLKHVDPVGTVLLPAFLYLTTQFMFGWAKPVPVDFSRLNHPRRDSVLVALAGPGTNIALAVLSALLIYLVPYLPAPVAEWAGPSLAFSIQFNAVIAVFNMLPLPPLDGGRVAVGLLPRPLAEPLAGLERWGMAILLAALFLLPYLGDLVGLDLNIFRWLVGWPTAHLVNFLLTITGLA
jgi:Zn-dependent protease